MGYVYVEIEKSQATKKTNTACGDVVLIDRDQNSTIIILADGMGSGVKASIYATMCVSRLRELLKCGFTLLQAFAAMVRTMNQAARENLPYAVFSIARIINDGLGVVLSFEMPPPIYISKGSATVLKGRSTTVEKSVITETNCHLSVGDALLLVSDGVTQAGIGRGLPMGLGPEGVCKIINGILSDGRKLYEIPHQLQTKIYSLCNNNNDDDVTSILAYSRIGAIANVLSGPPINKSRDFEVCRKFFSMDGTKIVCGGTTASIVSKYLNKRIDIDDTFANHFTPPKYSIEGVDLVTEGAVTLNQLYNVLDEDRSLMDEQNPVTELYDYLMNADRINFFVGTSYNPATDNIGFVQQGLLSRKKIIPLLAARFRELGKVVVIEEID